MPKPVAAGHAVAYTTIEASAAGNATLPAEAAPAAQPAVAAATTAEALSTVFTSWAH
jgi:hypothetical protein